MNVIIIVDTYHLRLAIRLSLHKMNLRLDFTPCHTIFMKHAGDNNNIGHKLIPLERVQLKIST